LFLKKKDIGHSEVDNSHLNDGYISGFPQSWSVN
jgi:hypothetical protein